MKKNIFIIILLFAFFISKPAENNEDTFQKCFESSIAKFSLMSDNFPEEAKVINSMFDALNKYIGKANNPITAKVIPSIINDAQIAASNASLNTFKECLVIDGKYNFGEEQYIAILDLKMKNNSSSKKTDYPASLLTYLNIS